MPTYEYICEKCGHELEEFQSITAKPLRKCPKCSKASLKRLIGSGSGVIFKGGGFYHTDYRTESYKKGKDSERKASKAETKPKKTKTEKKDSQKRCDYSHNRGPVYVHGDNSRIQL